MNATQVLSAAASGSRPPVSGGYKVDISRGERIGRVSSEWFSRPNDERYLSLSALYEAVRARAQQATARTVETRQVRVEASRDDAERLALIVPGREERITPTHWSFGQMASLVGAPAGYLRQLPAALAGINLQHGLLAHRGELIKTLEADDGRIELRAVTGPDYGRIWDHELVAAVMRIAGDGTGDTRWKVPGLLDWSTMTDQVTAPGATWLDRQLVAKASADVADAGFGRVVRDALDARTAHLASEGLARRQGQRTLFARDLIETLRTREVSAAGARLAAETGSPYQPSAAGEHVAGAYRQRVTLTSGRFAMIDNGLGFQLVPWTPAIEPKLGHHVSGVVAPGGGVDWSFGRKRGLGL